MGGELRKFIQEDTPAARDAKSYMDQWLKVPTSAVVAMTENFIAKNPNKKIILDGVIRSKEQNDALAHLFGDFKVVYFELSEDVAVERLSWRRIDPVTQETFPASFTGDKNPKTGNTLITRADDVPEAIRNVSHGLLLILFHLSISGSKNDILYTELMRVKTRNLSFQKSRKLLHKNSAL